MKKFIQIFSILFLSIFPAYVIAQGVQGLSYETYRGTGVSPSTSPLTYPTVLSTGVSQTINFNWGGNMVLNSGRSEQVIVRWTGFINIPSAGLYSFGGNADDGIRININNTSVVNSWIDSGGAFRSGNVSLPAGAVPIEVWYYENGGGAMVNLQWYVQSTGTWQIVPSTMLATQSTFWAPPAPQYTSNITAAQQTRRDSAAVRRQSVGGNSIYIDQVGDSNTINITQQGNNNQIKGVGQQNATVQGNSNNVTIRQGNPTGVSTGKNLLELKVVGDSNTLNLNQGVNQNGTADASDSNNHYQMLNLSGSNNTVTTVQKDSASGTGHFMENTVSGSNNIIDLKQSNSGSKILFTNVNGNSNNIGVTQKDSGTHYLDVGLTGNGHTVNVSQEGAGNHRATISLNNAGASGTINLNQLGSTGQIYSIQQSCTTSGCGATITQGQ